MLGRLTRIQLLPGFQGRHRLFYLTLFLLHSCGVLDASCQPEPQVILDVPKQPQYQDRYHNEAAQYLDPSILTSEFLVKLLHCQIMLFLEIVHRYYLLFIFGVFAEVFTVWLLHLLQRNCAWSGQLYGCQFLGWVHLPKSTSFFFLSVDLLLLNVWDVLLLLLISVTLQVHNDLLHIDAVLLVVQKGSWYDAFVIRFLVRFLRLWVNWKWLCSLLVRLSTLELPLLFFDCVI